MYIVQRDPARAPDRTSLDLSRVLQHDAQCNDVFYKKRRSWRKVAKNEQAGTREALGQCAEPPLHYPSELRPCALITMRDMVSYDSNLV
jgi:hypothetical protein